MSDHDQTLLRVIEVGRALVAELDPDAVLDRILREAREMTGAEYAALGILSEDRLTLARFLTSGIPPNHPPMRSFLGVPIIIRGQAWGNLYLCEKSGAEQFSDADEDGVTILAQWAGTAIENARLYESSESRRIDAERAVRAMQAAQDIADAIGSVAELDRVLELIVKRGRALVEAQSVLILLREGDELVVASSAGHAAPALGRRLPIGSSIAGRVLERGQPQRIAQDAVEPVTSELGVPSAHSVLLVPMFHRAAGIGVLVAVNRGSAGDSFGIADEQLLRTFAASASNAVAIKRSVESDRLHATIAAAETERRRWARDLHDQTLQALGALRLLLSGALRRGDPEGNALAIRQAVQDIETEIENLRGIITDLRPSMLDDLGLGPALEALLDRRRETGLRIESAIELPPPPPGGRSELEPELSTTIYRLVQESLTNVVKHAQANACRVMVRPEQGSILVEVTDDGRGFDTSSRVAGFGLAGLHERVYLVGGTIELDSSPSGTTVCAHLPVAGPAK